MKLSVKNKVRLTFGLLILMLCGLTFYNGDSMKTLEGNIGYVSKDIIPEANLLQQMDANVAQFRGEEASHILATSPQEMDEREAEMNKLNGEIQEWKTHFLSGTPSEEEKNQMNEFNDAWNQYLAIDKQLLPLSRKYDSPAHIEFLNQATDLFNQQSRQFYVKADEILNKMADKKSQESNSIAGSANDMVVAAVRNSIIAAVLAVLIGIASAIVFERTVLRMILRNADNMKKVADGQNVDIEGTNRSDEIGVMAKALNELKEASVNNARLKLALDSSSANVMMADQNFNIIYINGSLKNFLKESEKDIQKDLPRFSTDNLIGVNMDIFHKNPAHQRGMIEGLKSTVKTSIQVGGRSYNLVASPIFGRNNERLGTVVEWLDGAAAGMVDAINKSQAVIEFQPDGTIMNANANFLNAMGYSLEEVKGKHHSIFCEKEYTSSPAYRQFWEALGRGEAQTGEFKRLGKGGKEVWINAAYNPIADLKGKIVRVVKTAADVTEMVTTRTENEKGMNEAVKVLTGISQGNLTQKMEIEYKGNYAQIKTAINATVDRLYDMVRRIIEAAQSVNSAAGEIAAGSTDLSQRTEEQASSLEETAASMEQITGTVKQNSSNAATANELSGKANQVASDGGKVVEDAVSAMGSIEKSSKKISDIIGVIDEIAFQTNLLALNAAVEAARAGDAGKGFAVVASEVRSLAGRSASASKEIKALISESAQQVQSGAELVNQAGETLKNIVASVKQVSGIVSEIASASQEQATGIDEINTAITQMDEVTQQNAALVEENTAAATSMVEQSRELEKLMSFFTLSEEQEGEETHPNVVAMETPKSTTSAKPKSTAKPVTKSVAAKGKAAKRAPLKSAKVANGSGSYDADWQEF